MSGLLILGAGGHGKGVAETALATGRFKRLAWLNDKPPTASVLGLPILGSIVPSRHLVLRQQYLTAIAAIGNPYLRLRWQQELQVLGYEIPTLIHPQSTVSQSARIGSGSVVLAQAAINAEAMLGEGCIVNTSATIDHDCQLGAGVHCCPGSHLAGEVRIGACSCVGIGAAVIQQICFGSDVTIGAGAVVVRDLPDGVTTVGVPAPILPS